MILAGLLDPGMHEAIPKVFGAYTQLTTKQESYKLADGTEVPTTYDDLDCPIAKQIRRSSFPIEKIHFVGIFDTVSEIGYRGRGDAETSKELSKTLQWVRYVAVRL